MDEKMDEKTVANLFIEFLKPLGLEHKRQYNAFNHPVHDAHERSFKIDLAFGPFATKGNRTSAQKPEDERTIGSKSQDIDDMIDTIRRKALLARMNSPLDGERFERYCNPNPMASLAIEVENNTKSKYFPGSLLAASIVGRWGILLIPSNHDTQR
jgi:hypothetical protein